MRTVVVIDSRMSNSADIARALVRAGHAAVVAADRIEETSVLTTHRRVVPPLPDAQAIVTLTNLPRERKWPAHVLVPAPVRNRAARRADAAEARRSARRLP